MRIAAARRARVRPEPGDGPRAPGAVDADEVGAANMILTNGARLYVDHAHPEYSAPEVTDPMRRRDLGQGRGAGHGGRGPPRRASVPGAAKLQLYKNNVDGKGACYGTHENYLMSRQTPFSADHRAARRRSWCRGRWSPARPGRHRPRGDEPGFQLTQRADYIEVEVGLETTLKRGIINTRDEPHADADKYRRLHVIIGDANLAETSTYSRSAPPPWCSTSSRRAATALDLADLAPGRAGARGARGQP